MEHSAAKAPKPYRRYHSISTERLTLRLFVTLMFLTLGVHSARAGKLVVKNDSKRTLTCVVEGVQTKGATPGQTTVMVAASSSLDIPTGTGGTAASVISSITCGSLRARDLNVSGTSSDRQLVFTGRQQRSLKVVLYALIPTSSDVGFGPLVSHIIDVYQRQHPDVLLNLEMDPASDIYTFDGLQAALKGGGADVMEVDTLFMGYLAQSGLINRASITGEAPLPVALQGSTVKGELWGIPSWMCTHFIFSFDPRLRQQGTNFSDLMAFLQSQPASKPALVGDYDGRWTLPSLYIHAYAQAYGSASLQKAMVMPPDAKIIDTMLKLATTCESSGKNACIDGTYHNADPGTSETDLAAGRASDDEAFSEQSFFIRLKDPTRPLYAVPLAWAKPAPALLYNDAFVTSAANCAAKTPCAADAEAFTTLMTSTGMKNYIVMSQDLKPDSPRRTLLVSNANFWLQPAIQSDALYRQFAVAIPGAQPFPNSFTQSIQQSMDDGLCTALKKSQATYSCKISAQPSYQP